MTRYINHKQLIFTKWQRIALFHKQGHACAVCGTKQAKRWVVEHCHRLNKVRGITCNRCNVQIGRIENGYAPMTKQVFRYLLKFYAQNK